MNLNINNKSFDVDVHPSTSLLTVLRDYVHLTGTKYGCGEGSCGACTVLVDNAPVRSCITPIAALINKKVLTVEGLEQNGKLHPVQQAYLEKDAFQCAYCASGMIMSTVALLEKKKNPSEDEIIEFMNGNICRCGTYPKIVKAIQSVHS